MVYEIKKPSQPAGSLTLYRQFEFTNLTCYSLCKKLLMMNNYDRIFPQDQPERSTTVKIRLLSCGSADNSNNDDVTALELGGAELVDECSQFPILGMSTTPNRKRIPRIYVIKSSLLNFLIFL